MITTLDSGVFPGLGIRADRKTPAPWSVDLMPGDSMLGAPTLRPRTANHLKVVAHVAPVTGWLPPPPPLITRRAVIFFQLGLAAMCLVSAFVL